MTFRSKLMLTMAPLVLALAAVGVVAGLVTDVLAREPSHIWRDNYRSVLAAQRMKESAERLNESALLDVLGVAKAAPPIEERLKQFERELAVESRNITEPGESEVAARLRDNWARYRRSLDKFHNELDPDKRRALCFGDLSRDFSQVKQSANQILDINQDATVRKGQRIERRAAYFERVLIVAVLVASVLGLLASVSLTTRLLRPLGVVSAAVRRFGQGDVQARAHVKGEDDIARLAQEFNTMADHLERYRKSSLGELLQAQQASQAVIDSMPDPVLMLDVDGSLQGTNEAARKVLRIDPEEKGSSSLERVDPNVRSLLDRLRAHVLGGRGGYSPKGFEDAVRITAGEGEFIYLPRATPIYSENGSVTGSALVLQDITRLFRFDELKNNLVATVAHEFRTPLTSLRMAIHLCTEEAVGPLTRKQADLLFAARDDCERLHSIVDDLLNLARLESGRIDLQKRRVEVQSLVDLAVDVHKAAAESQQLALRAEVYPGLAEVFADPDRLQLVFANLLANAIRYSPKSGEIVVRALPVQAGLSANDSGEQPFIRFEISDSGPGIPAEHQESLFEKFFRVPGSPSGGAGLGLFIARGIVQAHDGRIGVSSQAGKGATFWFTIPSAPERSLGQR
jgi:two-component system, NtrC family, sensor histidine kinase KinB